MFEYLYQPMKLHGDNIDSKYFQDLGDGTYKATPLLIYNTARDAEKYFKRLIFQLDNEENPQFQRKASIRETNDKEAEYNHNQEWKRLYGEAQKKADEEWKAYQDKHYYHAEKDEDIEFEPGNPRIYTGDADENRYFNGFSATVPISLTAAVQAYNAARELLQRFAAADKKAGTPEGPERSSLPFIEPLYSKPEFKEKHANIRADLNKKYGIPEDTYKVPKVMRSVHTIDNKKCLAAGTHDVNIKEYSTQLIEYLTNTSKVEFKAKAEEMRDFIDKDFEVTFNEKSSAFKAEKLGKDDDINIYTVPILSEEVLDKGFDVEAFSVPVKIITLSKVDLNDSSEDRTSGYNYTFNITLDGEELKYKKAINTKGDLRKAIETSITMVEDITRFRKYCDALKDIIDNL